MLLPLGAQTLVYSVPAAPTAQYPSMIIAQDTEYGSAAQLAGTDRNLQSASVSIYSNVARSAEVTFSIYEAIPEDRYGPSGSTSPLAGLRPADTPLWTSGETLVNFTGPGLNKLGLNTLNFTGINTLVPTDLFWSISFTDVTGLTKTSVFGPKLGNASAVGPAGAADDPGRIYIRDAEHFNGEWVRGTLPNSNYALTVTLNAVPEPSVTLLIAGVTFAGFMRRRRP
jgi:hypothetical protein